MRVFLLGVCLSLSWLGGLAAEPLEVKTIRVTMKGIWEKPDAPLSVDPIALADDYAIADWEQGEMGGRALLKKKHGTWEVLLCTGDEIRKAETLRALGVVPSVADQLADNLARLEAELPRSKLDKFGSFKGLVRMDESQHPK